MSRKEKKLTSSCPVTPLHAPLLAFTPTITRSPWPNTVVGALMSTMVKVATAFSPMLKPAGTDRMVKVMMLSPSMRPSFTG